MSATKQPAAHNGNGSDASAQVTVRRHGALRETAEFLMRVLTPVVDAPALSRLVRATARYPAFIGEYLRYRRDESGLPVRVQDLWPCLNDRGAASQSGAGHYFYQDVWALRKLADDPQPLHIDIGSRVDGFVGQATALGRTIVYVDIRPVRCDLPDMSYIAGDILRLPFRTRSVQSLSCLNVLEHIGLGRYGDALTPEGPRAAAAELARVMMPGGRLLLSVPVGRARVQFNAHRVFSPRGVLSMFEDLQLVDCAGVDDAGRYHANVDPDAFNESRFACGFFELRRTVEAEPVHV